MRTFLLIVVLLLSHETCFSSDSANQLLNSLKLPDHFAFIRHAIAPGIGDPPEFTIGNCQTQRNLSDEGRKQAEKIGKQFHQNGIKHASIFSSQWCRCLETARLLDLGSVQELPIINSFFGRSENAGLQTETLKQWLFSQNLEGITVLVSHQVNITALTGMYPASGEIIIVRRKPPSDFEVVGTIITN